jgi:hypothetical protein
MTTSIPRASAILAGLALILLPLVAVAVKTIAYPGWMLVVMIYYSPILLIGYATQIVVAANGLLRERGVLRTGSAGRRPVIAAWLTSVAVVATAFYLVDGGDDGRYGSVFTELMGTSSTAAGESASMAVLTPLALLWVGGWLWLVTEWIVQLVLARRVRERFRLNSERGLDF